MITISRSCWDWFRSRRADGIVQVLMWSAHYFTCRQFRKTFEDFPSMSCHSLAPVSTLTVSTTSRAMDESTPTERATLSTASIILPSQIHSVSVSTMRDIRLRHHVYRFWHSEAGHVPREAQ
jgi:hypothetical protein